MNNWRRKLAANGPWLGLCLVLLLVTTVRLRLLSTPLERDEGEYAYAGQLMLEGVKPYTLAYVIKLPGPAAAYAVSMALFGQTAAGVHAGLLIVNLTAIILLFLLTRRCFGSMAAFLAAATYALMSLGRAVDGTAAHATQFIVPAALGGILLLWDGLESRQKWRLFGGGILFGLAFVFKQPGLLFGLFGGVCLVVYELGRSTRSLGGICGRVFLFSLGVALPFGGLCLAIVRAGAFRKFWFWCFTVAGGGWISAADGWRDLTLYFHWDKTSGYLPLWGLAGIALVFLAALSGGKTRRGAMIGFCVTSVLAVAVGFTFNPHYFIMALPAVAMLLGGAVVEGSRVLARVQPWLKFGPALVFLLAIGCAFVTEGNYLFGMTPDEVAASLYGANPFREAKLAADYLRAQASPDDLLAVLGSEPEIYFYAHRHSATGHVSTYILTGRRPYSHAMQEEMVREIQQANPAFIVLVNTKLSWASILPVADNTVMDQMQPYVHSLYELCGVVDTETGAAHPVGYWDNEAAAHVSAATRLFVYRRRKGA